MKRLVVVPLFSSSAAMAQGLEPLPAETHAAREVIGFVPGGGARK